MLNDKLKEQLKTYLSIIKTNVELVVFTDTTSKSIELNNLVEEIAILSDKVIIVSEERSDERVPSMIVRSATTGSEVRFAGIPMGHEFTSLVMALLHSGGHPMKIEADLIEQVRQLKGSYKLETYISLSCQNCPDVVQALSMMAAINPQISHVMIDGSLFQKEVFSHNILSVPTVYLNGKPFAQGRISLQEVLNKLDGGAEKRQAETINKKAPYDVLIVGGDAAGASAAIYAARKGVRTGIVADRFGKLNSRKRTGSAFAMVMIFSSTAISIQGELSTLIRDDSNGYISTRFSCKQCGNQIYSVGSAYDGFIKLQPGTLEETNIIEPEVHL